MNAKKVKQLRKVAKTLVQSEINQYKADQNVLEKTKKLTIVLDKMSRRSIVKELKKSFS